MREGRRSVARQGGGDPLAQRAGALGGIRYMSPRPVDGIAGEPRNDVPVAVVDGLSGFATVINHDVERRSSGRRLDSAAEFRKERAKMRCVVVSELAEVGMVALGHEQDVANVHRADVEKRDGPVSFQHLVTGDGSRHDLAEDTTRINIHRRAFTTNSRLRITKTCFDVLNLELQMEARPDQEATNGRGAGALTFSFSPRRERTAIGAASPWRTLASLKMRV